MGIQTLQGPLLPVPELAPPAPAPQVHSSCMYVCTLPHQISNFLSPIQFFPPLPGLFSPCSTFQSSICPLLKTLLDVHLHPRLILLFFSLLPYIISQLHHNFPSFHSSQFLPQLPLFPRSTPAPYSISFQTGAGLQEKTTKCGDQVATSPGTPFILGLDVGRNGSHRQTEESETTPPPPLGGH